MQALSEARPGLEAAVNAFRHSLTPDAAEHRALHGQSTPHGHPGAAPAASRAPLQNIHNQPSAAADGGGGGGAWADDAAARGGAAKERMARLLDIVNEQPGDCTDALRRLVAAVAAVPRPAWEVWSTSLSPHARAARFATRSPATPRCAQAKGGAVVATAAQLLELNYYGAFPAACDLLKALVATHPALLEAHLPLAVGALLATYNTLPVVEGAELVQHVESTLDTMAHALDPHALMQARHPSPPAPLCTRRTRDVRPQFLRVRCIA